MLYKHLREHFTSLAVSSIMNEELAITRGNMIDIDYTTNQIQKTISSMKLSKQILILRKQCLFNIIHLFNINGYCYQCILLSNNNICIIKLKGCHLHNYRHKHIKYKI